ncbi:hypothetical protein ACH79_15670 [Bradyrhizobium sp. CCBAU 051011]|nr:hypothetical protein ACH79_15670 [Bradyrhizobium sp. CCBAU 051011]
MVVVFESGMILKPIVASAFGVIFDIVSVKPTKARPWPSLKHTPRTYASEFCAVMFQKLDMLSMVFWSTM